MTKRTGMFLGMSGALFMHFAVLFFKIPFPGYSHSTRDGYESIDKDGKQSYKSATPTWIYFILICPALFDLVATALFMFGLRYVNVSIYQMLRG